MTTGFGIPLTLQANFTVCPSSAVQSAKISTKSGGPGKGKQGLCKVYLVFSYTVNAVDNSQNTVRTCSLVEETSAHSHNYLVHSEQTRASFFAVIFVICLIESHSFFAFAHDKDQEI